MFFGVRWQIACNSQIDETKVKKMKATEIKNYQNLTAKDIVLDQ